MKKHFIFLLICSLMSSAYSLESIEVGSSSILNTWIWEKSIGGGSNPYTATPKTAGFTKKVVFTPEGKIITYKNNVEIRVSNYQIEKGPGFADQAEHNLITFEGKTYIIENLDNQNLTIVSNNADAVRTIFKR